MYSRIFQLKCSFRAKRDLWSCILSTVPTILTQWVCCHIWYKTTEPCSRSSSRYKLRWGTRCLWDRTSSNQSRGFLSTISFWTKSSNITAVLTVKTSCEFTHLFIFFRQNSEAMVLFFVFAFTKNFWMVDGILGCLWYVLLKATANWH